MTIAAITPTTLLQLTRTGPRFLGAAADEERLRQEFARVPCLRFASLLAARSVAGDQWQLEGRQLRGMLHAGIGQNPACRRIVYGIS